MDVELRFFATYREAVGRKTLEREFRDGATVGEILASLEDEFEGLSGQLLADGAIREQLSVMKNGRDVVHMAGVETELEDGDRLSVFPPVAGGADDRERSDGPETADASESADRGERADRREKSFRGISVRLAVNYLENLGGERVGENAVEGEDWRADLSAEKVGIGPSVNLTEVTVVFEGDPETLDPLIEKFSQKAMRAGG